MAWHLDALRFKNGSEGCGRIQGGRSMGSRREHGRVIYVFEVQSKGSLDSLILNLLKSMHNAAVQDVVAVSDATQLEKFRTHAAAVPGLREKLKHWNYTEVLGVHGSLEAVNETINRRLVPQGF